MDKDGERMTVAQLITQLQLMKPDLLVTVQDNVSKQDVHGAWISYITKEDAENSGDCEGRENEQVVVIGVD